MARFDIAAGAAAIVAELAAAGVRSSVDPRNVNPPAAWVSPRSITHELLSGGGTITYDVWLIAPDTGVGQALAHLTKMLDRALSVLAPDADTSLAESVVLPGNGSGALPAFRLTIDHETC